MKFNEQQHTRDFLLSHPGVAVDLANQVGADNSFAKSDAAQDYAVLALREGLVGHLLSLNSKTWWSTPAAQDKKVLQLYDGGVAMGCANHEGWSKTAMAQDVSLLTDYHCELIWLLCKQKDWCLSEATLNPAVLNGNNVFYKLFRSNHIPHDELLYRYMVNALLTSTDTVRAEIVLSKAKPETITNTVKRIQDDIELLSDEAQHVSFCAKMHIETTKLYSLLGASPETISLSAVNTLLKATEPHAIAIMQNEQVNTDFTHSINQKAAIIWSELSTKLRAASNMAKLSPEQSGSDEGICLTSSKLY